MKAERLGSASFRRDYGVRRAYVAGSMSHGIASKDLVVRMGREGDAAAVVDQYGRLYGCRNVTVADASIMPEMPSVQPYLTCMLITERIAAHLRGKADDE